MSTEGHIRSSWRDPVGKPLTNAIISRYQNLGYYGEIKTSPTGIVHRCLDCSSKKAAYFQWKYLPRPGFYCATCVAKYRNIRDKEEAQEQKLKELILKEYE